MSRLYYNNELNKFAVSMRKGMTMAERKLWKELRNKKFNERFYRQKVINNYIVDFYCHFKKIVIEIDGDPHYIGEGQKKDLIRDKYLQSLGLKVLRFTNIEVLKNTDMVLRKIWLELENE